LTARVLRNVGEREVVARERAQQEDDGDRRRPERRDERVLCGFGEPSATVPGSERARNRRVDEQQERGGKGCAPEIRHLLLGRVLRRALRDERVWHRDERAVAQLAVDDDLPSGLEQVRDRSL